MNKFILEYKIDEQGSWLVFDKYDTVEEAIKASGEALYDGFIVRIVMED